MANIDNSEIHDSKVIIAIKSLYLFICFFLGVCGNSIVIIAIIKNKKLQTITNCFVLNLAITDLLFAVCEIPTIIFTTISKKWLLGRFVCDGVGFLNSLFCTTSIWTLVMISINRYFNVAKATQVKSLYTKKRTILIIIGVWMFSAIISFPPLVGWSEFKSGSNFCTINGKKSLSYSIFIALIAYILPSLFLSTLYLRIFFMLYRHEKTKMRGKINTVEFSEPIDAALLSFDNESASSVHYQTVNGKITSYDKKVLNYYCKYKKDVAISNNIENLSVNRNTTNPEILNARENNKKRAIKKYFKEVRVTKMLMILVLCFFFCWTPVFVGSMLYSFNLDLKGFQVATFGIMCACLNCVLNPLIYSIMNRSFQKCVIQMWKTIALR
ncbi:alpha-1A adrenergic receptor [Hydra vulgaris]|uniref:5-hydroxytryptamine receptor 1A n=1 Tax=Hydra vulgaris TaxID=6087 RepID=T2MH71_HYDVU|nr:alpha-1A adrenergic receptor [Hydra vulgaris]